MSPVLVAAAITVVAGAIVAVSSRDARIALLGLAVTLIGAPLLADPIPDPLPLAARIVAAVLATELAWIAVRATTPATRGSLVGWPVEALVAVTAFVVGFGAAGAPADPSSATGGSDARLILGAAFAVMALTATPLALGRDVLRLGIAATCLVIGATIVRVALVGGPTPLEQLVVAGVTVGLGVAIAAACGNVFAARGDLSLGVPRPRDAVARRAAVPQAHQRSDERV